MPHRAVRSLAAASAVITASAAVLTAAVASSSAWAVGFVRTSASDQTLILHWNGKSWRRAASPSPGGSPGASWAASR